MKIWLPVRTKGTQFQTVKRNGQTVVVAVLKRNGIRVVFGSR
jgi:hypothetical protein